MRTARYTKPLTITLTEELYSAIKKVSDDRSISMGEAVRDVLEETFSETASAENFNQAETAIRSSRGNKR